MYDTRKIRGFPSVFQNLKELPLSCLQAIRHASVQLGSSGELWLEEQRMERHGNGNSRDGHQRTLK